MGRLLFGMMQSLDGYIAGPSGALRLLKHEAIGEDHNPPDLYPGLIGYSSPGITNESAHRDRFPC